MAASADDVALFGGDHPDQGAQPSGGSASPDDVALFSGSAAPEEKPAPEPHGFAHYFKAAGNAASAGLGVAGTLFTDAADAVTAGGYSAARNWVESKIAPEATRQNMEREASFNAEHPMVASAARALGYLAPGGVASTVAKGVDAGVSAAAEAAPSFAQRFLNAAPVRGAITGGLTSGLQTAAESSASGAPLAETAREAGRNALIGAGVGGAFGAGGAALDVAASKVLASKGAQARELLESRGAKVGLTTPGKGGVFDGDLAGVPANDRGIAIASKTAAKKILDALKEDHARDTLVPYKKLQGALDASPAAKQLRDVTPLVEHMQQASEDLGTAPHIRSQLEGELKLISKYRTKKFNPETVVSGGDLDGMKAGDAIAMLQKQAAAHPDLDEALGSEIQRIKASATTDDGPILLPERQLNGLRRSLMRSAKVGTTDAPGEAEAPLRSAAFMAKQMVDEGPYGKLNELYAKGAQKNAQRRVDLGLKAKPAKDAALDARKLRLTLQRQTQNTGTGGGEDDLLAAFRARNPDLAPATELPQLAKARADLSFHVTPHHGGLMGRAGGEALGAPLAAYGLATHPLATAGALAAENATALTGRVLTPLAREAQLATRIRQYIARGLPTATAVQLAKQDAQPSSPPPMSPEDLQL